MALPKLFQRIFWHNNTTPDINEDNLNAMSKGLSDVDDRLISLAGTIMEDVPQIQEDIEDLEADMALIDTKIASATSEANRATTAANIAAASVISAGNKALISEGYAKGTQNGTPVGSSSPYYHNNAEYFKEQAKSFTPTGYQDLVDDVEDVKQTLSDFEDSITGEVVDSEPYVLRQGKGNLADMDLVGGSLVWNQLVQNGNFASTSGWTAIGCTFSVANNVGKITASEQWGRIYGPQVNIKKEHKYFLTATIKGTTDTYFGIGNAYVKYCDSTSRKTYNSIINVSSDDSLISQVGGRRTSGWTEITVENFMFIDLTQMFGSTIADYIYSLEQAHEGDGVAWFRKYFPNAYYGYQSGKIESVNVTSRKVVGKNVWDTFSYRNSFSAGGVTVTRVSNNRFHVKGIHSTPMWLHFVDSKYCPINNVPYGTYTLSIRNAQTGEIHQKFKTYLNDEITQHNSNFTFTDNVYQIKILVLPDVAYDDDITLQLEYGSTATDYEPYKEYTFHFANKQLRGIPKLVDNKLSYDGDVYTADGTVTRKYGIVDLGTLAWGRYDTNVSGKYRFASNSVASVIKAPTNLNNKVNIICSKYETIAVNDLVQNIQGVAIHIDGNIMIYDEALATGTAEAFKTAMSGVYAVYELATPTTESANAYQNPQRAFIDGTEEFVDYGVQSATRDVSIPVGNNTTYQLNETLPPIEDYVDGALKFKAAISALGTDESGRTTASRAYTTGEFFYKDGKMYKVLTSIAQGATFTINTNCQQTTLFAELKALA